MALGVYRLARCPLVARWSQTQRWVRLGVGLFHIHTFYTGL